MKRNMIVLLTFFVSIVMVSTPAYAGDIAGRLGIGLSLGAAMPTNDPINDYDTGTNSGSIDIASEASIGEVFGIEGIYGISDNMSITFDMTRRKTGITDEKTGYELGDVTTYTLVLALQPRIPVSDYLVPYFDFGMGININAVSDNDIRMDNTIAFKIGAGMDYFINEDFALNIKVNWIPNNTGWKYSRAETIRVDDLGKVTNEWNTDLDSLQVLFGVRYFFE
ncbi:MAG: porin family protein [Nitrospinota bacterium]